MRPIALLTDFGYSDAYVGAMKGVILSRYPGATLVDITHAISPQDIRSGALQLAAAAPYFPPETVFLAVVDPGVGSERRAVCARAGEALFVGPDNGLLWPAACALGEPRFYHLDRPEFWLPQQSATFHGRDIFAPVAATLAAGARPDEVGTPIEDPVTLELPRPEILGTHVRGEVLLIDHYGNCITNLRPADLQHAATGSCRFRVGRVEVMGPASHYDAAESGATVVVVGSLGYYEIAINGGSAAKRLGLCVGSAVEVELTGPDISTDC